MLKRIIALTLAIAAFTVVAGLVQANTAKAEVVVVNKVEICHSRQPQPSNGGGAGAQGNPYGPSKLDVSVASIFSANGHDIHDGAVFNNTGQDFWGDIIPPFYYESGSGRNKVVNYYPGMNWTVEGQAIYNNNCQYPFVQVQPEGKSHYKLKCELLKLKAPKSIQPEDASYQYYLNGQPVALGNHDLAAGEYTLTLKVNNVLVDTDVVTIEACDDGEVLTPDTSVAVVCPVDGLNVELTFTNTGTAASNVTVNGTPYVVAAGATVVATVPKAPVVNLTIVIDGQPAEPTTVTCPTGGSGGNGETPTTPTTPVTVVVNGGGTAEEVVSLPVTSGSSDKIASIASMIGAVLATVGGYVVRMRYAAQL